MLNPESYDASSGGWGDKISTHQTNLYPASHTPFSADGAVKFLVNKKGVPANKILIGAATYSRGSGNSDGLGKPCSGNSPDNGWEPGVCELKTLPRPGATEYFDEECQAAYSYDPVKRIFNSYDNARSAAAKAQYVLDNGLAGIIIWDASSDFPADDPRSVINAINRVFTTGKASSGTTPQPSTTTQPTPAVTQTPTPIPAPLAGTTPQNQLPVPTTSTSTTSTSTTCCNASCNCCQNCPCHKTSTQSTTTTQPSTSTSSSDTPQWKAGVKYTIGTRVVYQNRTYQCINNHTSQNDWTPTGVPSLWKTV